ncbi:MAG: TIGR00730 family Rossman fold protein [Bacteroidaceae bacterium]|nr:TIGR00730 family Rossman fold protein [Bacteroidaceae bacterium]
MKIGVFCSANNNIADIYFEKTKELGRWMGENHHTLVYGGCNSGLMECVAEAVKGANGTVIGVVPTILEKHGRISDFVDVAVHTDNLSDRKDLLLAHSDVIIALPGGIGTLDEIFTVAAAHTIGYHAKKVILYNIEHFYDSLIALLNDLKEKNMVRGSWEDKILCANTFEELIESLQRL